MITAGDKGGASYAPKKMEGMDDPGPRCPKCGWGVSIAAKAEDRIVTMECLNADCNYKLTIYPGGIKDEIPALVYPVPNDDDNALPSSLVRYLRGRI